MKLQYCSDLHLEFPDNKKYLEANPLQPVADILLLAGDIVPFKIADKHKDFFNFVSDHFKWTYWLPGNHEYYYSDISNKSGTINEKIRKNVSLVNNVALLQDDVQLIFSTLWSHISPAYEWQIEKGMNDFHVIRHDGNRFSASQFNRLHHESLHFLKEQLQPERGAKKVVITHHVPTFFHYPDQYKSDILSQAFASEQYDFIESSGFDHWIYGHHHCNIPAFQIGKTKVVTNQLGYVQFGEHRLFDPAKVIEL